MTAGAGPQQLIRFGLFEVDLTSGEVRRQGLKIKLHGQPFQVLALLLERPGEVVTREELQHRIWPADTFVDFDHGLNKAINKIREALGDTAESPRFVETFPRRGYRFIAPVNDSSITAAPAIAPLLAIPRGAARGIFMFIQLGYLIMYGAALSHLPDIRRLPFLPHAHQVAFFVALWALCGSAVRLYLLSAVAFDYPQSGRLFRRLFPGILAVDLMWAASPLLLLGRWGEFVLLFVAGLAFLPFSQRTLVLSAYAPVGGRISHD